MNVNVHKCVQICVNECNLIQITPNRHEVIYRNLISNANDCKCV